MWGFPDFNFDTFAKICKDATIELNNNLVQIASEFRRNNNLRLSGL